MDILGKINGCETMRELDEMRIEVINAMTANNSENFETVQKAFVKKKNSLKRGGHTRRNEGDVIGGAQ